MTRDLIHNHFNGNYAPFYLKYLPNSQDAGNEIKALCPFHADTTPSLTFNKKTGLFLCHSCKKGGDIFTFYGELRHLDIKKDFGKILQGIASDFGISDNGTISNSSSSSSKIITTYDYTDHEGKLLFQVCRMDPKDFRQRTPNGNGGWIWKLNGVQRVPYNLPTLKDAQQVIIVEGEKDADNLRALGFISTCNAGGAGKWLPEYNEHVKDKTIILIPDNDTPGKDHMIKVAQSLQGVAASIKWLDLPDLPDKGDISDFIGTFQDREVAKGRLFLLLKDAPDYKAPEDLLPEPITIKDAILSADAYADMVLPEREHYLHPWLRESSITLISAPRGVGKSMFVIGSLLAIASGTEFGPWQCLKSVPVLYLDGEMAASDDKERLAMFQAPKGIPFYLLNDAYASTLGLPRSDLTNCFWREDFKNMILDMGYKVVAFDNIASLAPGLDENSKQEWDIINQWLLDMRFSGIAPVLVHHMGKNGTQRGTSGREDNIDISISLVKPSDYTPEDGCRFIAQFTKHRLPQSELSLITDTEFKLVKDGTLSKHYTWAWGNPAKASKKDCLRLLVEGTEQKSIPTLLGVSKGTVSKWKTYFISNNLMTDKCILTTAGELFLGVKMAKTTHRFPLVSMSKNLVSILKNMETGALVSIDKLMETSGNHTTVNQGYNWVSLVSIMETVGNPQVVSTTPYTGVETGNF